VSHGRRVPGFTMAGRGPIFVTWHVLIGFVRISYYFT
jgi:hypothetical protein